MKNLVGQLLISPPCVQGNFFQQSVTIITEEHSLGHIGITLNKPSHVSLTEFVMRNDLDIRVPGYVHLGGPVNTNALTMIHSNDWACSNTMPIDSLLSISSSPEILTCIASKNKPTYWRIFVGVCSWAPGQLAKEINGVTPFTKSQSWLVATPDVDSVFNTDPREQWKTAINLSGSEFVKNFFV